MYVTGPGQWPFKIIYFHILLFDVSKMITFNNNLLNEIGT